MLNRRRMLQLGVGVTMTPMTGCNIKAPNQINFDALTPEEEFKAYIKTIGTLDTSDIYIWFKGVLWGVLPERTPAPLCGFQGLARHRWSAKPDGSFTQIAYDVGFFSDLETDQPTQFIVNPLSGEKVEVYHNKYGGFEQTHSLENFINQDGETESKQSQLTWSIAGDQVVMTERSVGQVRSKLQPTDWPRETSGPTNYYGSESSYATSLNALSNPKIQAADYTLFWSSFSPWEPWLLMDAAPGACQWRATGMKLGHYDEAPKAMLDFIEKDQPNYFAPSDPWEGYRSSTDAFIKDRKPSPPRTSG